MKKLDPKVVWLLTFQYIAGFVSLFAFLILCGLPTFFTSFFSASNGRFDGSGAVIFFIILFCSIVPLALLSYVFAKLTYNNYMYELQEDGFHYESGVISKKYVTIPYERIQNIDIYRGLLARIIGLSDLQIQTAGMSSMMSYGRRGGAFGNGSEGRLPGLDPAVAVEIRTELLKRAKGSKGM